MRRIKRRIMHKRVSRGLGLLSLALACAGAQAAGNEIVVGEITDQSPAWIEAGRDYIAGAKTYFDLVNSEGGINGKKIVHVVKDAGGKSADVQRVAGEMLAENKVDVLFGSIGDATMRSLTEARTAEKQKVVVFAPLTGLPSAQRQVKVMRASYADEARSLTRHFTNLGLTSFCVVHTPGTEQKESLAAVREAVAAINRKLACEVTLAEIAGDAARTAQTVAAARPQAVFVLGDTSVVGNFIRAFNFKSLGITVGALSVVNHTALIEIAGPEAARGVVITQVVPSPQKEAVPVVREHVRAMRKFRDEPPSQLTLEGFVAAKTLVEALRKNLGKQPARREDITAALVAVPEAGFSALVSDYANSAGGSTRMIEVTMVGRDGSLVQ